MQSYLLYKDLVFAGIERNKNRDFRAGGSLIVRVKKKPVVRVKRGKEAGWNLTVEKVKARLWKGDQDQGAIPLLTFKYGCGFLLKDHFPGPGR